MKVTKRAIQIGVIGSMADIKLNHDLVKTARQLGREIAGHRAVLLFGFEGDFSSVSALAALSAQKAKGQVVAFAWSPEKPDLKKLTSIAVVTGQARGGGREFSFILSCDAIISLGGGSGTLMEISMAYQAKIPVIAIKGTSGWSEKLIGQFLDDRKRQIIIGSNSPAEAVTQAITFARQNGC